MYPSFLHASVCTSCDLCRLEQIAGLTGLNLDGGANSDLGLLYGGDPPAAGHLLQWLESRCMLPSIKEQLAPLFVSPNLERYLILGLALVGAIHGCLFLYTRLLPIGSSKGKTYSYIGDDYPRTLPVDVPQTFEYPYTEHLDYFGLSDNPEHLAAWASLMPPGYGAVWLGPRKRRFVISMFHQIHCLSQLRASLQQGDNSEHVAHCLNYILQMVLCAADTTLEPEKEPLQLLLGVPRHEPNNITHLCRDWTKVYEKMETLYWK